MRGSLSFLDRIEPLVSLYPVKCQYLRRVSPYYVRKRKFKKGKPFHLYQHYLQSHHTSNHWTQERPQHFTLEFQGLYSDSHTNVAGINRSMRSQVLPLDNCISNFNTNIDKYTNASLSG